MHVDVLFMTLISYDMICNNIIDVVFVHLASVLLLI